MPHEVILLDLYSALKALNALTGETTVEDILGQYLLDVLYRQVGNSWEMPSMKSMT